MSFFSLPRLPILIKSYSLLRFTRFCGCWLLVYKKAHLSLKEPDSRLTAYRSFVDCEVRSSKGSLYLLSSIFYFLYRYRYRKPQETAKC